jgi:hypothetical protein
VALPAVWAEAAHASGAAGLPKGISGGNDVGDPGHAKPNDLLLRLPDGSQPNLDYCRAAGVRWLKVWVDWSKLQPQPAADRSSSWAALDAAPGAAALDQVVAGANAAGLHVILTLYQAYPEWVGTPPPGTLAADGTEVGTGRARACVVPDDVGPDAPWGWFVGWLAARYAPGRGRGLGALGAPTPAAAQLLEVVNEPNLLLWPQAGLAAKVAAMVRTGDALAAAAGLPGVLGPALHDGSFGRGVTPYRPFATAVLDALAGWTPAGYVGWSMHNYVEVGHGLDWPRSHVRWMQDELTRRGWGSAVPAPIWVTESGYAPRVGGPRTADELARQDVLGRWNYAMLRDRPSGAVVWMQHLWNDYPHPGERSHWGLRDAVVYGPDGVAQLGAPRPFWATFRDLPDGVVVPPAGVPTF